MGREKGKRANPSDPSRDSGGVKLIYHILDLRNNIDNRILRRIILRDWRFIMRTGGYLVSRNETGGRRPLHMAEIGPLADDVMGAGSDVHGVSISILWSEKD